MKAITSFLAIISGVLITPTPAAAEGPGAPQKAAVGDATLTVNFRNITATRGRLFVELCTRKQYEEGRGAACSHEWRVDAKAPATSATFKGIAAGEYALQVFHDVDDDGDMKTGMFGIPKEPVGASNDAKGRFGPPNFDDMRFEIGDGQEITLTVNLYAL